MTTLDLRLAIPAVVAWVATVVLVGVPTLATPVAVTLWMIAGVLCSLWIGGLTRGRVREWLPAVAVTLAATALCATAVAAVQPARTPPSVVEAADSGRQVTAQLTLSQTVTEGRGQFDATIVAVDGKHVRVPVAVFGAVPNARLPLGSTISLSGTVGTTDAGDHASFLFFARTVPRTVALPPPWLSGADDLRARFLSVTGALPGDGGVLLPGLAIGDTSEVDAGLDSAMKESSLSHLTAVSGANCAIVVGLIMFAGAAMGWARWARVLAALGCLVAFVVLVTPEPSVLRAAVMATIVLGALASGRPVRGLPVLSAAVVLLLVLDPWLAREFGFALSVLATAGLLTLAGPVTAFLSQYLPPVLAAGVAIPASAQLACQPVLILLDASIPTYGVVANILAAPAAPLATIVGLVSCLLSSLLPVLGTALAWLAWVPAVWIAGVASFFASLPLARLPWPEGEGGAAVLAVLSALGVVAMFSRARTRKWATLSLCVTLAIYSGVFGGGWLLGRAGRPDWQIAACDVGQGDSFVVRSLGQIAVIDAGKNPELLRDCLDDIGVSRIDLLVLTHFDLDHVGGVQATFGRVGVALVGETSSPDDEALLRNLADGGAEVQTATPGASGVLGELAWRIIWPSKRGGSLEPGNDASVVIEFRPAGQCADGCLSSMFLGDLGAVAQSRLLASGTLSTVDVVKVSHHGSADQDPRLYLAANATVGLIGVGENNYGHPDQRALNMLTAAATAAQRTDLDGLTLIAPGATAGSVMVWTQR